MAHAAMQATSGGCARRGRSMLTKLLWASAAVRLALVVWGEVQDRTMQARRSAAVAACRPGRTGRHTRERTHACMYAATPHA
eukprot:366282-Chlamydomonas_euryale.AAC.16